MTHFIGIDVGTSAVKIVLVDDAQTVLAEHEAPLAISRPRPDWSEQEPDAWWDAAAALLDRLARDEPAAMSGVGAIGLSGQMHGAVLLGDDDRPLRPAMLWNDGRAAAEALALRTSHPDLPGIVGVLPMAGFTGPKMPWLARHEPAILPRLRTVMLPKDYVRLMLTGEKATEMSDAAGTWWLDEARRAWSPEAAEATGLPFAALPPILESAAPAGMLRPELAARWGLQPRVVVAAGAGDAAAGAIGIGAISDGDAFLSIGTSGQLFVTTATYRPAPATAVHAFAHALPGRWFQMGAMLNGASCLAFAAGMMGGGIGALLDDAERGFTGPATPVFLPYLSGERTPHDDPQARGVLFGLSGGTGRGEIMQAVLEGVAFSFVDARDALAASGTAVTQAAVIGGGARSTFWMRIMAAALGIPLKRYDGAVKGPAYGAARLARLAFSGEDPAQVCTTPPLLDVTEPDSALHAAYTPRIERFRRLYRTLRPEFANA